MHFVRRIATVDVELNGAHIAKGDKVAMYYVSANRDEAVFEDPNEFIIDRAPNEQIAFGRGGPHFCLGAHVARLQVRLFLDELRSRVSRIEQVSPPVRLRSNHINGINESKVIFHA